MNIQANLVQSTVVSRSEWESRQAETNARINEVDGEAFERSVADRKYADERLADYARRKRPMQGFTLLLTVLNTAAWGVVLIGGIFWW